MPTTWCFPLIAGPATIARFNRTLSASERRCMEAFARVELAQRYIVAHGVLRALLAREVGDNPAAVEITLGEHGKPYLACGPAFSLSHCADRAVVAISHDGEIGVDIERVDPCLDIAAALRGVLAPTVVSRVDAAPSRERHRAWFNAWVRHESALKRCGRGVPAADHATAHDERAVVDLDVGAGYVAAVALPREDCGVRSTVFNTVDDAIA